MYQLVSILRAGHLMISSRYHGIVTSMPALVPSAGVTMDERIRNLMQERGHSHLLMNVDDPELGDKLVDSLDVLQREREAVADGIGRTVVNNLKAHGAHGSLSGAHRARALSGIPHPGGRAKLGRLSSAVADRI